MAERSITFLRKSYVSIFLNSFDLSLIYQAYINTCILENFKVGGSGILGPPGGSCFPPKGPIWHPWIQAYLDLFWFLNLLGTVLGPCTNVSCSCGDPDDTKYLNIVSLFWTLCLSHFFRVYDIGVVFIYLNMNVSNIYHLDVKIFPRHFYRVEQSL